MQTFLLTLLLLAQSVTGLEISVVDAAQIPVENLELILTTYTYREGAAYLREEISCRTDAEGTCSLLLKKPDQNGMQRGTLQIGEYGYRDLLWSGGILKLVIPLAQVGSGRESAPYEFQIEDGGVPVLKRSFFSVYTVVILLLLVFLIGYFYQKSKETSV